MEMLAEINVEDPNVMSVCHQGQFQDNDFHQPVDNKNNLSGLESAPMMLKNPPSREFCRVINIDSNAGTIFSSTCRLQPQPPSMD